MPEQQAADKGYAIPLEYHVSAHIQSMYATHLVVQHSEHEFLFHFYEARGPILLGTPEEVESKLKSLRSVRAECVARIIVAADRMPEFVEVLHKNLENYLARKAEGSES